MDIKKNVKNIAFTILLIVDEICVQLVKLFVKHFFGSDRINAELHWYRQKRGNFHAHELARFEQQCFQLEFYVFDKTSVAIPARTVRFSSYVHTFSTSLDV